MWAKIRLFCRDEHVTERLFIFLGAGWRIVDASTAAAQAQAIDVIWAARNAAEVPLHACV